jgi:hypothetical protein
MNVETDVALVGQLWLAGVKAHPQAYRSVGQRTTGFVCGGNRGAGAGESDEEGVPLGVDFDAVVACDRCADEAPVFGESSGILVAELLEQARRALDVGEEEGDRAARQLLHVQMIRQKRRGA